MKLAILGTDSRIVQLAASARELGHELAWVGDVRSEDKPALARALPAHTDEARNWELLLDRGEVDAVLVGLGSATSEVRTERLKRLAAEGIPTLVTHPIATSVLPYYEIDMVRRESGCVVQHFNLVADPPGAQQLAEMVRHGTGELGIIHQLTCERRVAGGERIAVLGALAKDVELLATLAGDIRRVSAMGPSTADSSFASLQVQMTATHLPALRWSVGTALPAAANVQFTLHGEHGLMTLREIPAGPGGNNRWQLESLAGGRGETREFDPIDPATAIERLANTVAETDGPRRAGRSTWDSATRAMEVVDAVELSLQKGRTIEVIQQALTERLAFRGTMAALGCGVLMLVFLAALAIAVLGGAEGIVREKFLPSWPLALLAALAFFLLLQAVPFLVQKKRENEPAP